MDTRLDRHLQLRQRRRLGTRARAGAMLAAGAAVAAAILIGVVVLIVDGHSVSWLAGLAAGAAAAVWLTVGRGRAGVRAAASETGAQRRTELAVEPLEQRGWSFQHGVAGRDVTFGHIAVGPGGLILLESISPSGVVRMIGGEPFAEHAGAGDAPPRMERLRPSALADAGCLREYIQRIAGRRMWVQAVVVLWSEFPAGCVADGRCVYIHGSRLAEWMSRRPHQLDEAETEAIDAAVRELAARGADLDLPVAVQPSSPLRRSSSRADADFSSPSRPMPRSTAASLENCTSR